MPIHTKWGRKKPPAGFEDVEPVLEALENELKDVTSNTDPKIRKLEALWPVHQINWQKSRYIYDLFYVHHRISKQVYQYCINQKLVDAALIAKWKKPGYERLCSTYVINPTNYKFGTTSICRVPWSSRSEDQKQAKDPTVSSMRRNLMSVFAHFFLVSFRFLFSDWLYGVRIGKAWGSSQYIWEQIWTEFGGGSDCS